MERAVSSPFGFWWTGKGPGREGGRGGNTEKEEE